MESDQDLLRLISPFAGHQEISLRDEIGLRSFIPSR